MKTYSGVAVQLHSFLTSALNGSGQRQDLAALTPLRDPPVPIQYGAEWAPEEVWAFRSRDKSSP